MGNLYQQALVLQGRDKALVSDQRRWIADRDSKCKAVPATDTKSCVLDMTKARLATLAGDVAAGSRSPSAGEPPASLQTKSEIKHEAKAVPKVAAKPTAKWETEPEAKSVDKAEAAPEPKHEARPDSKVAAKPETKSESKPESKPKGAHGTKSEAKPEIKPEIKPETKREAKLETKHEVKSKAKPEAKTDAALANDLDCTDTINVAACREAKRNQGKNAKK